MKINFHAALAICAFASTFILSSCNKDDDQPEIPQPVINEPEQITSVELEFTSSAGTFKAKWADPDGIGGNEPTIDSIILDSGITYDVHVHFLDESGETVEDLTPEILEEASEHIVCFEPEGGIANALTISRLDTDGTYEVGLESSWETTSAGSGELHLSLKHQPDGLKDGTCVPGATDVEVHFDVTIN